MAICALCGVDRTIAAEPNSWIRRDALSRANIDISRRGLQYRAIRLRYVFFRGCFSTSCDPMENCGPRVVTSDRFASMFYTCVIYVSPKLSWHEWPRGNAATWLFSGLCTYTFEHAVIKFIWTMSKCVCLSPRCQSINKKEKKRFYKPRGVPCYCNYARSSITDLPSLAWLHELSASPRECDTCEHRWQQTHHSNDSYWHNRQNRYLLKFIEHN